MCRSPGGDEQAHAHSSTREHILVARKTSFRALWKAPCFARTRFRLARTASGRRASKNAARRANEVVGARREELHHLDHQLVEAARSVGDGIDAVDRATINVQVVRRLHVAVGAVAVCDGPSDPERSARRVLHLGHEPGQPAGANWQRVGLH
eukprot:5449784-Prymnesium_polylepis.1